MKIIVRINGGIGNQLFQWIFAQNLALFFRVTPSYEISYYRFSSSSHTPRSPILIQLWPKLNTCDLNLVELEQLAPHYINFRLNFSAQLWKIFKYLYFSICYKSVLLFKPPTKRRIALLRKMPINYCYIGSWIDYKYLSQEIVNEISERFDELVPHITTIRPIDFEQAVAIHVRRTDYFTQSEIHNLLGIEYYFAALDLLIKEDKNPIVYIFTDDIKWCKENMQHRYSFRYISDEIINSSDLVEFILLSKFRNIVISNSTFSMLAALLNQSDATQVIAPKAWFKEKIEIKEPNMPNHWIRI